MKEVTTVKTFTPKSINQSLRNFLRDSAIRFLSPAKNLNNKTNCIQFPYYHHVFNDEIKGFRKQLRYLRNYGDFISLDEACTLLSQNEPLNGRYFCVSFDDGFHCTYTNMLEVTTVLDIPIMIYLPTDYIDLDPGKKEDLQIIQQFHQSAPKNVPFLNWDQCREMLNKKTSFGSHTSSHARLIDLKNDEIKMELIKSKRRIEKELGVPCHHFAVPWGRTNVDFDTTTTVPIIKELGFKSLATTNRGHMSQSDSLFSIKRQHLLANWDTYQLKYFFGA